MIKTILLDIGEVLIGFDVNIALREIARQTSLSVREIQRRLRETPDIMLYEKGKLTTQIFYRQLCRLLEHNTTFPDFQRIWTGIFHLENQQHYLSHPFLMRLKGRYRLVAVSNTNAMHFNYLRDVLPLLREFDEYVLSYEVGSLKPEEAIFRKALAAAGSPARECLFIDDRPENVRAAAQLGIEGIVFQGQKSLMQELKRRGIL